MPTYRDMTFCANTQCNKKCHKYLTCEIEEAAKKFGLPLAVASFICLAAEKIMVNPLKYITSTSSGAIIQTTKITTPEGVYRIFLFDGFRQGGITAVRIK